RRRARMPALTWVLRDIGFYSRRWFHVTFGGGGAIIYAKEGQLYAALLGSPYRVADGQVMTATILKVPGSTMMISSLTTKYIYPRHAGCTSTIVDGTVTRCTDRGTTVPTLTLKSTLLTRLTLPALSTVSRILVRCSVLSDAEVDVDSRCVEVEPRWVSPCPDRWPPSRPCSRFIWPL